MKAFSKMSKLRLLKIHNVELSEGPDYLSNELRFLEWHGYPSKSLPTFFQVDNLVELDMSYSTIEQLGHGFKRSINLKIINLSHSINLTNTPDFTGIPNLSSLILEGCTSLFEVHPSLGHHKKLQLVNLVDCNSLRILPSNLEMESLKVCRLDGCLKLEKFPDIVGNMNCLRELRLDGTGIAELSSSIHHLVGLEVLDLCACNLGEGAVPEDIGCLSLLRCLDLSRNNFVSLPKSLNQLSRLEILALEDCRMLESLAEVPSKVQTVNLNGCIRLKEVPDPIKLSSLKRSEFSCLNCWELYKHNGQDSLGLTMLERYLQDWSNPRPGFGVVVPGNEILGMGFDHHSKGSSISVQVLSKYLDCDGSGPMGFAACVAFSAYNESSSLFCHFKANGRENHPSPMCISCNSIQVLSDHLWLFYLSFDYLKELKEWQHESFSNIELSFHSNDRVEVKNCGVSLIYSPSSQSSAASSSSQASAANSSSQSSAASSSSQSSAASSSSQSSAANSSGLQLWKRFISGLDLANLVVNADLLQLSCGAIKDLLAETNQDKQLSETLSVRHKLVSQSNCTIIAFATSPLFTKDHILRVGDLVSSSTLKEQEFPLFDFLCSKGNPSFSIHRAAINLFQAYFQELSQLKAQIHNLKTGELLVKSQLIVTGHSLGGSIAYLFTLWLLDNIKQTSKINELPLCVTFGSPLIGDQGLQLAISRRLKWNYCFLHVAANKDPLPRIFITSQANPQYMPFGTYFFCSESGCNCVDDPEVASRLLKNTISQVSTEEMGIDDYSGIGKHLKSRLIMGENSQLAQPVTPPFRQGIILQLKAVGVEITAQQQQNNSINDLISELERHINRMALQMKATDPKSLNQVKIKMAYLEWYKKDCKTKGIGYYDSYKNLYSISDREVTRHKKVLVSYWKKLVEDAEQKPQKEGGETWLFAGTNYRRMVEPLDIAEYYRQTGKQDYKNNGRSKHYILLEKWQKEHTEKLAGPPNDKKKQSGASSLTEDSCFWMNVEEALISCKLLKDETSSTADKQSAREFLNMFEQYVMDQMNNYAVSPEIFLERSSFMKWWKDFQNMIETSHDSPLSDFMKNGRYCEYEKGKF
ncbi:unnamed protein product [Dovyalis caffra]|uniref:Uncharacterized protein n=1 Tax=Dovyalis caffra TaxID=77055 RepID=A0AAV1RBB0_9ROSI|nr:unnamed protein product [Dovyalis caffra]